jgi:mannosyl-oligosaccharide alpha-1,2-mannosidase
LKYFFLLFSPDELLPLDGVVFNTEAHPFPRFQLGKLFSTGWHRKPRRSSAAGGGSDGGDGLKLHEVTDQKTLAAEKKVTEEHGTKVH